MTDTQTELNELYEAMCEAGIWPEELGYCEYHPLEGESGWYYGSLSEEPLHDSYTLFIARGVAEEWLWNRGWNVQHWGRTEETGPETDWTWWSGEGYKDANSLPAAIRYAHKQGTIKETKE